MPSPRLNSQSEEPAGVSFKDVQPEHDGKRRCRVDAVSRHDEPERWAEVKADLVITRYIARSNQGSNRSEFWSSARWPAAAGGPQCPNASYALGRSSARRPVGAGGTQ